MNSDPYDSAAWRTFGMLDADETAIFDEAMRHDPLLRDASREMDRLSAALAAAMSTPVTPRAGQLERLKARLGVHSVSRGPWWLAASGWAAAAVLAVLLFIQHRGESRRASSIASTAADGPQATVAETPVKSPALPAPATNTATQVSAAAPAGEPKDVAQAAPAAATPDADGRAGGTKVETKRLIQEIAVLRENLEQFHDRDRFLFDAVPGIALPIVMVMNPPGVEMEDASAAAPAGVHSPIAAMLGDAVKVLNLAASRDPEDLASLLRTAGVTDEGETTPGTPDGLAGAPAADTTVPDSKVPLVEGPATLPHPSAIPIYDAARDAGTLVVSNLPPAATGKVYNLWVTTAQSERPIYVGSLPPANQAGADSFDFSLGSNMILPSGFVLTQDPAETPSRPSSANTVLQGPPGTGK